MSKATITFTFDLDNAEARGEIRAENLDAYLIEHIKKARPILYAFIGGGDKSMENKGRLYDGNGVPFGSLEVEVELDEEFDETC